MWSGRPMSEGSGAGVILEGPGDLVLEQSLRFDFKVSNNEAEYEAMIAGLKLAKEVGVKAVKCRSNSQLVIGQVRGAFQTREPHLTRYLCIVNSLVFEFEKFEIEHISRDKNSRADLLSKLASTKTPGGHKTVIQETLSKWSIEEETLLVIEDASREWMEPIWKFLTKNILPEDAQEARKLHRQASR